MITLADILTDEQSIFKHFSSSLSFGDDGCAFWSPDISEVPHWNLFYPRNNLDEIELSILRSIKDLYKQKGMNGYIICTHEKYHNVSAATDEYFYFEKNANINSTVDADFTSDESPHLDDFCNIVGRSFEWEEKTGIYFRHKMDVLSKIPGSLFYVVSYKGQPCGTASTFRTSGGRDFLFNVSVLPELRGLGIASQIIRHVAAKSEKDVLVYSGTPAMRESILPDAGFKSAGLIHLVPLEKLV